MLDLERRVTQVKPFGQHRGQRAARLVAVSL
jgi:hypothetical protein